MRDELFSDSLRILGQWHHLLTDCCRVTVQLSRLDVTSSRLHTPDSRLRSLLSPRASLSSPSLSFPKRIVGLSSSQSPPYKRPTVFGPFSKTIVFSFGTCRFTRGIYRFHTIWACWGKSWRNIFKNFCKSLGKIHLPFLLRNATQFLPSLAYVSLKGWARASVRWFAVFGLRLDQRCGCRLSFLPIWQ